MNQENNNVIKIVILSFCGLLGVIAFFWFLIFAVQGYGRWNRLQNEDNQTRINDIKISQTAQLVKVQQQKAQIEIAQAIGIAKSQSIIKSTITPTYLQYLAIEAQKDEINSPNHTVIYLPSGDNGIPLVQTTNQ